MVHRVKEQQPFFDNVARGLKTAEIRLNDRNYNVNDFLILEEFDLKNNQYSGKQILVKITDILSGWGLKDNYVMLSFIILKVKS